MTFQDKMRPNRKKNLSSKIIVDEYDHLMKNSKIQPNYQSFMEGPLSPNFRNKDLKFVSANQQSSESQYSMRNYVQNQGQKQCYQCGQILSLRIYESHIKVCQDCQKPCEKQKQSFDFCKKDEYDLFSMSQSLDPGSKSVEKRSQISKKLNSNGLSVKKKTSQLKKSNSKKSINSHQKNPMKRPTSSTRNKFELKGYQNLKQKILSKLQGTNRKKVQPKKQQTRKVSSSLTRNQKQKSTSKNNKLQCANSKYNTINCSSINHKSRMNNQNLNLDFNRSQVTGNWDNEKREQKQQVVTRANFKQEKKQTLKKKNINYNNNCLVSGHSFQRQKQGIKNNQSCNFTQNNSYVRKQSNHSKYQVLKNKELIRQQLKKEGVFRRQSSSSASKLRLNRNERQIVEDENNFAEGRYVHDQYYFFENHPSSLPFPNYHSSGRRQGQPSPNYESSERQDIDQKNTQNIIRNKLGINKHYIQPKELGNTRKVQPKNKVLSKNRTNQNRAGQQQFIRSQNIQQEQQFQKKPDSRQYNLNGMKRSNIQRQKYLQAGHYDRQRELQMNSRNLRNQDSLPERRQNIGGRQKPPNLMGNQRQAKNRGQNMNLNQNRPQPQVGNHRLRSQNQNPRVNSRNQNTNLRPQQNQTQRGHNRIRNNLEQVHNRREANNRRQGSNVGQRQGNGRRQGGNVGQRQGNVRRQGSNIGQRQGNGRGYGQQRGQRQRQNQNRGNQRRGTRNQNQRGRNGNGQGTRNQAWNFISHTLNEQFEVMNGHFNLLNNIFTNLNSIVNVNITSQGQNPTTFVFRNHGRRRHRENEYGDESSGQSHSQFSDFSSDFSEDDSTDNQTDYDEDEYYYEDQEEQNPGMSQYEINSIPILRYNKVKHGSNQCTICLVELNQNEPFKKLFCDHVFHKQCIDEWLKRKNACPVCRDQMGVRH